MIIKRIQSNYILVSVLTLVVIILGSLYIYLVLSLYDTDEVEIERMSQIANAGAVLKEEQNNTSKLSIYLIPDGTQALFVSSLEASCASFNLSCTTSSLSEAPEGSGITKLLNMNFVARGSLQGLHSMITNIETSIYPIDISKVSLNYKEGQWEGMFEITAPVLITQ